MWTLRELRRDRPLYLELANQIEADVRSGRLVEGDRLPPQRNIARAAGVDLTTASRAYAEAARRGLVVRQVGRGTFVSSHAADAGTANRGRELIDMSLNIPSPQSAAAAAAALAPALRRLAETGGGGAFLGYGAPGGSPRHRSAGVKWLEKRGVDCAPERVVVAAGGQHALSVLLMALCTRPRSLMSAELTYPALKTITEQIGITLVPLACDPEGILPSAMREAAAAGASRVVYLNPTLHNPTTATMSAARRREIIAVAAALDLWIIEDDVYGLLQRKAPRALQSLAAERVFHIASLSKVVAPGLRTAFIATPDEAWAEKIAAVVRSSIWMAPPLTVEVAASWISDGTAERLLEVARSEAERRQEVAASIWDKGSWLAHPTSFHGWLSLPAGWTTAQFVAQARLAGISVTPAEAFWIPASPAPAAVRLSLSAVADMELLADALKSLRRIMDAGPNAGSAVV